MQPPTHPLANKFISTLSIKILFPFKFCSSLLSSEIPPYLIATKYGIPFVLYPLKMEQSPRVAEDGDLGT